MARLLTTALVVVLAALALAGNASARGGNYGFEGGTKRQQAQVRGALAVSSFDWSVVRRRITVHIGAGIRTEAVPGHVRIDSKLLDTGVFSWGVVQHEYAHQVDFFLLDDADHARLLTTLGGSAWWSDAAGGVDHLHLGSERFASTLAWAYWPSARNSLRPQSGDDEAAALEPAEFRALMARVISAATLDSKR
jgi:hypothetical protein